MYEKSISNFQRVFHITIPDSPTLILDLLSVQDRANYDEIINGGVSIDPTEGLPLDKVYKRVPVDGYVLSNDNFWYAGAEQTGAFETIPIDERYTFPLSFWLNKAYIYAPSPINGIIRIFFS